MSLLRQTVSSGVRNFPLRATREYASPPHWHDWDQLTLAVEGTIRVDAAGSRWFVPPGHAIWIPAGARHVERVPAGAFVHTLYLGARHSRGLAGECRLLPRSPLLHELVAHIGAIGGLDRRQAGDRRLIGVLVDLLRAPAAADAAALTLPAPRDPRARRVADAMQDDPAGGITLPALARRAGASVRTIERLFLAETGMTIGDWRQRLRLLHAAERLAGGERVAACARAAGYASVSAFIVVFRRAFGMTPKRFSSRNRHDPD